MFGQLHMHAATLAVQWLSASKRFTLCIHFVKFVHTGIWSAGHMCAQQNIH